MKPTFTSGQIGVQRDLGSYLVSINNFWLPHAEMPESKFTEATI